VESIERVSVGDAVERFVTMYEHDRARMTAGGVRKELRGFAAEAGRSEMGLAEISREMLEGWIARGNPGARFFNNRRATWKTFLNRCRSWGWWPGGLPTPAEEIERRREPVRAPEILPVKAAAAGLIALRMAQPDLVPYFVLGCWTGLRPTELLRIRWGDFDWEMGHLHVRAEVARKTLLERFVPLEANVIALLRDHADVGRYRRREPEAKVCGYKDAQRLSAFLRAEGIVTGWTQDVMRHSCISYRIARGDSLARIAEEAGNSESIIRRRYRRPVRASEGAEWFAVGSGK
jgi:integrase